MRTLYLRDTEHRFRVTRVEDRQIGGVLVPFNEPTESTPHGWEQFRPGAFKRTLANRVKPLKLFVHHDRSAPIGLHMELAEEPDHLRGLFRVPPGVRGDTALQDVESGLLDSFSIGFDALQDTMVDGVRTILEARLVEASLVALPAYENAAIRTAAIPALPPTPLIAREVIIINGHRY